jgi:uncharacterized protein YkwD
MKKTILFLMATSLCFTQIFITNIGAVFAATPLSISMNGELLKFDQDPYIENGRTMVPVRSIFEALDAKVSWDSKTKTVIGVHGQDTITLKVGSPNAQINNVRYVLDAPVAILKDRVYIPLRFVSESFGATVGWNETEKAIVIQSSKVADYGKENEKGSEVGGPKQDVKNTSKYEGSLESLIGQQSAKIIEWFGEPQRKDLSKYGFMWYIYNQDYLRYIQIGLNDKGTVVGVYSNSNAYKLNAGIGVGTKKSEINYQNPVTSIKKGNTIYKINQSNQSETFFRENRFYATLFYDTTKNGKVTSYQLIEKETELALSGYFGKPSKALSESFERQIFDLANAVRAREGKSAFIYDEKAATVARNHSLDMYTNKYFNHTNQNGKSPFDRMKASQLLYKSAGENIAFGQTSAIFAHEDWMNSPGHRKNILGQYERIGVGVAMGEKNNIYYTQDFYTPK